MSRKHKERGLGNITLIFLAVVVGLIIYISSVVLPIFYYYFEFQGQLDSIADKVKVYSLEELKKKITYHINKLEMPFTYDDMSVRRRGKNLEFKISYKEPVYLYFFDKEYKVHVFHFTVKSSGAVE